jgi:cbb3-type cytochrome oxidase subunit 3
MWGLLLVGLLIEFAEVVAVFWPVLLFLVVFYACWYWACRPVSVRAEREAREALRHEQARREIDRIALETSRAMYEAAIQHADVIEGTTVEIERR